MIRAALKMFLSPLPLLGLLANVAFVAIWVMYGFLPAAAYWGCFLAVGALLPKRFIQWATERHVRAIFSSLEKMEGGGR